VGLCDLHTTTRARSQDEQIEVFCNQVAGCFLLPEEPFLREPVVVQKTRRSLWENVEIRQLAEKYSVSQEVVLRRLLTLGRITESFYKQRRQDLLETYHTEAINSSDVAEMLGVRLKHLPTIEQEVVEPAA